MLIKDLIAKLQEFPEDMEVFVDKYTDKKHQDNNKWLSDVREPAQGRLLAAVKDMKIAQRACEETKDAKKCVVI